jgi:hypothetical protein
VLFAETRAKFILTIVNSMYMKEYLTKVIILDVHWWVNKNYKLNFTKNFLKVFHPKRIQIIFFKFFKFFPVFT